MTLQVFTMKWIRVTKTETQRQLYKLIVHNRVAGEMSFQLAQQSIRIYNTNGEQQVFFVSRRRPRRSTVVIETEYGFKEAVITLGDASRREETGTILYRGDLTDFALRYNRPGTELIMYDKGALKPRLACQFVMDAESNFTPIHINWRFRDLSAALIWGIYWHLLHDKAVAQMEQEVLANMA